MNKHKTLTFAGKVAIFIDAANIELSAKDLGLKIDYKKLMIHFAKSGQIVYTGFYTVRFENKAHDGFLTVLKRTGYTLVTKPLKIIRSKTPESGHLRKANFDVEIAVDAVVRIDDYDTMVLFSGDSDFAYLVKTLRRKSKKVVVVSLKYHVAKELIESADYYFDLRKIKQVIKRL